MIQKKICMLGAFAVGKTSLVARYVHSLFSEKYHTTVGVKIDKKQVEAGGRPLTLMLWDLAGEDEMMSVRMSYLRGASGCLLVVDGTRAATLATAAELRGRVEAEVGAVPFVVVLNKADLAGEWEIDEAQVRERFGADATIIRSSAKSGEGVEEAFGRLAESMLGAAS